MKTVMAVWDSAVQSFGQPFFVAAVGAGTRSFTDEVNRQEQGNTLNAHPDDYELYVLGYFNEEDGTFANDKRLVARAKDLKKGNE